MHQRIRVLPLAVRDVNPFPLLDTLNALHQAAATAPQRNELDVGFIEPREIGIGVVDDNSSSLDEKKSLTQKWKYISVSSHV